MSNTVIKVENLSKRYQLGTIGYGSLQHDMKAWWARVRGKEDPFAKIGEKSRMDLHGDFWALRDVDFEVQKGDRVGIIGRNGAGKSTLLKLLSRVTSPTTGSIKVKGRIASLLEVGTGFHPELTGRENIFLNGAILGMKRREIQRKFDEIVSFAGVEEFIETPVKRYSSGMYVRLAFSVAAHLDSEILVIDEVLAVGDAEFQKKCLGKMEDVSRGQGRTVLFVSHHLPSIKALCNKGIYLSKGGIGAQGDMDHCAEQYLLSYKTNSGWKPGNGVCKYFEVTEMVLLLENEQPVLGSVKIGSKLKFRFAFTLDVKVHQLVIGFVLFNAQFEPVYRSRTTDQDLSFNQNLIQGRNVVQCEVPIDFLLSGEYYINLDAEIHQLEWIINPFENKKFELKFEIQNDRFSTFHMPYGMVSPVAKWEILK